MFQMWIYQKVSDNMTKKPFDWTAFWKDVHEQKQELERQAREDNYNYVEDEDFEEGI
jgi:hypothetical protein